LDTIGCGAGDSANTAEESTAIAEPSLETLAPRPHRACDAGVSKPAIVLVHGAFADAFGWHKVMRILDEDGYRVTAVENPLLSLVTDVATTKRAIEAESANGPVVVVGHSFGGAAITGAAADETNVTALVYIDAFAPDVRALLPGAPCPGADGVQCDRLAFA
jgi:pimeloyl-ACP methyl ester carboxylesterase